MGRWLFGGSILAVLLYVGVILGYPYYQYVMMERAVEEAADLGVGRLGAMWGAQWSQELGLSEVTRAVTALVQTRAQRVGVELAANRIQVFLEQDLLRVSSSWEAEARLPGYSRRVQFRVEARRLLGR